MGSPTQPRRKHPGLERMVAWPVRKKEVEKKSEVKGTEPIWRRLDKKQVSLGLLITLVGLLVWYSLYQLDLLPAGIQASLHTLVTTFLISQKIGPGAEIESI